MVVWIVGLSGAGKSSIARTLVHQWRRSQPNVVLLDGPRLRAAVDGPDPEFSADARVARERRIAALCALLESQGLDVVCALNSVDPATRAQNRTAFEGYFEVHVSTPLDVCLVRDPEDLYLDGLRGRRRDVVGLDLPYQPPVAPDLVVDNGYPTAEPALLAQRVLTAIRHRRTARPIPTQRIPQEVGA